MELSSSREGLISSLILLLGVRPILLSISFLLFAGTVHGAQMPADFSQVTHTRLQELNKEVDNLKNREDRIPSEHKSQFHDAVAKLETEWSAAHQYQLSLKSHPNKISQGKMNQLISLIEKDIDRTENQFGENGFGLAGILGF